MAARSATLPRGVGPLAAAAVPQDVLSLPFRDSAGRTRHLSDVAGKVPVTSDSMTLCQESCPVTVDPQRDSPRRLAAYRRLFRPAPSYWLTLTGTPARVLHQFLSAHGRRNVSHPQQTAWTPQQALQVVDWLVGRKVSA